MKWLFDPCWRYHEDVSLLAVGALPEGETGPVRAHLAACAECRTRLTDLQVLAQRLDTAGAALPAVSVPPTLRARWLEAVRQTAPWAAPQSARGAENTEGSDAWPVRAFGNLFWNQIVLSSRRVWTGLAVVWVAILGLHLLTGGEDRPPRQVAPATSARVRTTLAERRAWLAELIEPMNLAPMIPSTPAPRRRSDYQEPVAMV
jgi:hypothetical protein